MKADTFLARWLLQAMFLLLPGVALAAITINSATVNGGASVIVAPGGSFTVSANATTSGSNAVDDWGSIRWAVATSAPAAASMTCDSSPNFNGDGTYTQAFGAIGPATAGTYNLYLIAYNDNACSSGASATFSKANAVVVDSNPRVQSINRASFDPSSVGTAVQWTVTFTRSVTGVDLSDFALVQAGGAAGASLVSVTGSGTVWTVTANTGTGAGTLRLDLIDNDSIAASGVKLGGTGVGNGNFTGQFYSLLASVCTPGLLFCDDFERSSPGAIGNGWSITPASAGNCSGVAGNSGCAGIDSDIPPFNTYSNPRPNTTRAMFTRWAQVTVQSPTVNLAGKAGAQLSFWMRRGDDSFSECPEASGENYLVKYRASDNTWKILAQYPSAPSAALCDGGPVYLPVIELPPDALHANFAMQFFQPSGSGDSGSGGAPGVEGYDYWHMDNVIIRETPTSTFTGAFCDNFEGGLGRWSVSAESAPASAAIGDARIGSGFYKSATHELDMRWGYVSAATFKTNMTGVSGNITYWVRSGTTTDRDPDTNANGNEDLVVEYLNSSGVWKNLATYLASDAAGTVYNASHALPDDAKHAGFRLRFRQLNGSGYDFDYWHIDDVCVGNQLPNADLAITKTRSGALVPGTNAVYTLTVTNKGPDAMAGSVQVVDTLPTGLSYLTHSGTGWTCSGNPVVTCNWSGTLNKDDAAPPLLMTVRVDAAAAGTLVNTATVTGTANDPVAGNNTATETAAIYTPSYVFTDRACTSGVAIGSGATPCNLINWSPQVAGVAQGNVYITALDASGVPAQLSGTTATTVGFQFALSCINPAANAGIQATFSATASALPLCAANGAVPTTWTTSTNLSFPATSPSVGPYSFSYADVGQVELYMRNSAATSQLGSSDPFVVKPYSLVLTDIKQTASPFTANPGATTAAGNRFVRAGENFSATVTAVNASCAANLGTYTQLASIPAACLTPNFGKESAPESISISSTLVAGLNLTNNPAITNPTAFGAFASASATGTTFTWDDVGIIKLTPAISDGDYLGGGAVNATVSGNVGRFYVDHFDVTVTTKCGGFAYGGQSTPVVAGQPFTVTATAMNAKGAGTPNYNATSGFSKSVNLSLASGGGAGSLYVDAVAGGNGAIPASKFLAGVGTVAFSDATGLISYVFSAFPTLPTAIAVHAEDADSVSVSALMAGSNGSASVRSGRLFLSNAYGSELLPLNVPAKIQYWSASGWTTNVADSCTALAVPTDGNAGLTNALKAKTTASLG
ncbi:MAG TPA: DUF6701 domain-containing protein, partial [Azonexus sp.]|nr:DUF6701 domain-containing protein [Azonexus sp.]